MDGLWVSSPGNEFSSEGQNMPVISLNEYIQIHAVQCLIGNLH